MRNPKAPGDQIDHASTWWAILTRLGNCILHVYRAHFPSETVRCSLEVSERTLDERTSLCPRKVCAAIFHFPLGRKVKIEQLIADMRVARKERKAVKCRVSTLKRHR